MKIIRIESTTLHHRWLAVVKRDIDWSLSQAHLTSPQRVKVFKGSKANGTTRIISQLHASLLTAIKSSIITFLHDEGQYTFVQPLSRILHMLRGIIPYETKLECLYRALNQSLLRYSCFCRPSLISNLWGCGSTLTKQTATDSSLNELSTDTLTMQISCAE